MRLYVFRLTLLALAAAAPAVLRGDDQQIAAQIVEKLQAEKQAGTFKGFSIDMQVDEGTVWLSGRVATAAQQAKALDIARRIPGVVQVVNDLEIAAPPAAAKAPEKATAKTAAPKKEQASSKSVPQVLTSPPVTIQATSIPATPIHAESSSKSSNKNTSAVQYPEASQKPSSVKPAVAAQPENTLPGFGSRYSAIGSGVNEKSSSGVVQTAEPVVNAPQTMAPGSLPYGAGAQPLPAAGGYGMPAPYALVPVFAGPQPQTPLAMGPARRAGFQGDVAAPEGVSGPPQPMYMPGSGVGIAPARYDHPQMPGYAWPSYAAHPNYAAVTYPKQYSPTAWPYIGPFYPYPQVPLGWRKVTMEWDDGWWVLDFKDRRTMYNHK